MRRALLIACFLVLAIAVFAANTKTPDASPVFEVNGVTPTAAPAPTQVPTPPAR